MQREDCLRPDLIFFTGDLAWGHTGDRAGFSLADQLLAGHEFLESVRTSFTPEVSRQNVFIIPGNHDVDRGVVTPQLTSWLERDGSVDAVTEMIHQSAHAWGQYAERLSAFRTFLEQQGYTHLLTDPARLIFHAEREVAQLKIGIAGFNSAWSCGRDREKGKLWLAGKWQASTLLSKVDECDIRLALVHHPGGWLVEQESNQFWRYGLDGFHVRLHGHEHESWVDVSNGNVTISAGACYDRSDKPNGYNIVRLHLGESKGEVWLRKYDSRGGSWGPDVIPNKTNGQGVWRLEDLRWLGKPKSGDETGTSPEGASTPIDLVALKSKVAKLGDQLKSDIGEAVKVSGVPTRSTRNVTVEQKVSRSDAICIQQTIVVHIHAAPSTPSTIPASPGSGSDVVKLTLEAIDQLIQKHKLGDADEALAKLESDPGLVPRDRFRILVKRGHLHAARQDFPAAVSGYRKAVTYTEPADKHARYFIALADELDGQTAKAHQHIMQLAAEEPDFEARAVCSLYLRTAPQEKQVKDLATEIGPVKSSLPEVAYTLGRRAVDEANYPDAERFARIAVAGMPDWLDARTSLAALLTEKAFGKIVTAGHSRPPVKHWQAFDEVFQLLTVAIATVEQGQSPAYAAALHMNLAIALSVVGRFKEATSEYRQAFRHRPDDVEVVHRLVMSLGKTGDSDEAVVLMRDWLKERRSPEINLLLAQILGSRVAAKAGGPAELDEAVRLLAIDPPIFSSLPPKTRADWVAVLVELQLDAGLLDAAAAVIGQNQDWLDKPLHLMLQAHLDKARGDLAGAKLSALSAFESLQPGTQASTVRQIALLLENTGEFAKAISVWQRISSFADLGIEERNLIHCAQMAADHETVIAACRALRSNGVLDQSVFASELASLEVVSLERLAATIQEMLKAPLDQIFIKSLRAQLSYTAHFIDRPDLVEPDAGKFPSAEEANTAIQGRVVVEVLRRQSKLQQALDYAYALYRRFPDDVAAHLAVLTAAGFPDSPNPWWVEPSVVQAGCAVRYLENDTGNESFCIIETLKPAKPSLLERSSDDPIAKAMVKRRVKEDFILRASPPRSARILEIVSKYTFRIRDCLSGFESRFPGHGSIIMIPGGKDGQEGVTAILRHLEAHAKQVDELERIYREQPVTLHIFGEALGRPIFDTAFRVAIAPKLQLHTCYGTAEEAAHLSAVSKGVRSIVIDASALATIHLLERNQVLTATALFKAIPHELLVSEHTLSDLRRALSSLSTRAASFVAKEGDQLVRHQVSGSDAANEFAAMREFISLIRTRCTVVPAEQPRNEDMERHQELASMIGLSGDASVRIVAGAANRILWTDELFVSELAAQEIRGRRIWTKALFDRLGEEGRLPAASVHNATLLMFRAGHRFTGLNAEALLEAVRKANTTSGNQFLSELLRQYAEPNITAESAVITASSFAAMLLSAHAVDDRVGRVRSTIEKLFGNLQKRPDGRAVLKTVCQRLTYWASTRDRKVQRFCQRLCSPWL